MSLLCLPAPEPSPEPHGLTCGGVRISSCQSLSPFATVRHHERSLVHADIRQSARREQGRYREALQAPAHLPDSDQASQVETVKELASDAVYSRSPRAKSP